MNILQQENETSSFPLNEVVEPCARILGKECFTDNVNYPLFLSWNGQVIEG